VNQLLERAKEPLERYWLTRREEAAEEIRKSKLISASTLGTRTV